MTRYFYRDCSANGLQEADNFDVVYTDGSEFDFPEFVEISREEAEAKIEESWKAIENGAKCDVYTKHKPYMVPATNMYEVEFFYRMATIDSNGILNSDWGIKGHVDGYYIIRDN